MCNDEAEAVTPSLTTDGREWTPVRLPERETGGRERDREQRSGSE